LCMTLLTLMTPSMTAGMMPAAQPNMDSSNSLAGMLQRMPERCTLVSAP
jgi:hypothetical protein